MTSDIPGVDTTVDNGLLRVTLNRPTRMNAVTTETLDAVAHAFASYAGDPSVRAAVLTGAGRAFCTGAERSFTHGHVQQLDKVNAALLAGLTDRLPALLAGDDETTTFVDVDAPPSTSCRAVPPRSVRSTATPSRQRRSGTPASAG